MARRPKPPGIPTKITAPSGDWDHVIKLIAAKPANTTAKTVVIEFQPCLTW
ncbi:MAG: hypothetical protein QOG76_378 [Pseudonocardiales bacterium]|nr:hypothetical protein [Pseudonocardiales bacterium]